MLLTAKLEIWLLGSTRCHAPCGFWRSIANLLVTGNLEEPLVEEAMPADQLASKVSAAISGTARSSPPVTREGLCRVEGVTQIDSWALAVVAWARHQHHPLDPAVVLELSLSGEADRTARQRIVEVTTTAIESLRRDLREKLQVARIETVAQAPSTPRAGHAGNLPDAQFSLDFEASAPVPAGSDDWGGGAIGPVSDAGGGSFGDVGDAGGGHL